MGRLVDRWSRLGLGLDRSTFTLRLEGCGRGSIGVTEMEVVDQLLRVLDVGGGFPSSIGCVESILMDEVFSHRLWILKSRMACMVYSM